MLNCTFVNMESKVLLCKIFIRILSDPDPNPNGLIGFGFGFGSLKTFGSFRIRIWIRIRIPNTAHKAGTYVRAIYKGSAWGLRIFGEAAP